MPPSSAPPAETPPSPQRVLLLVDDDDDLSRVFQRAFERAGFTVRRARTGSEAVALVPGLGRLDAAVVDLVLPGTGGLDVVRAIRKHAPACRVVAVTGLDQPSVEAAFRDAGADRFLVKPVDLHQLRDAVSD